MRRRLHIAAFLLLPFCLAAQDFQDVSYISGIQHTFLENNTFGGGVSFADFDGDGWDDLTFASHAGDSLYFYQNLGGTFSRVYFPGLETTCQSKQVMWVDLDNDGDQDFFVACHPQSNHLFENTGNMQFQDITVAAGLDTIGEYTFGASFGDIDNDGDLDMALFNRANNNRNILLYENEGNLSFTNITMSAGVQNIPTAPFCGTFLDYNTDGWLDLYIAEDKFFGNVLFENNGNNTFTDVSAATGLGDALDAMCVAPGDIDNDGDIDIYVTNTPVDGNHLFVNNGNGTYTEQAAAAGIEVNGFDWGANFFDVENDGDADLYVSGTFTIGQVPNSHLFINNGTGVFALSSPLMFNDDYQSYSNAIGDFNNDGFPDIAVNNYAGTPSKLWKNLNGENKTGGNWIKVRLRGTQSNIAGYGSRLEVYAGGDRQVRYSYCGEGFIAQNAAHEIFGIGTAPSVDSIVVTWLSGEVSRVYDPGINQEVLITEGGITTGISSTYDMVGTWFADLSGVLHFQWLASHATAASVQILSVDGRLIRQLEIGVPTKGQWFELDLGNHPPGVYLFAVSAGGLSWARTFALMP